MYKLEITVSDKDIFPHERRISFETMHLDKLEAQKMLMYAAELINLENTSDQFDYINNLFKIPGNFEQGTSFLGRLVSEYRN